MVHMMQRSLKGENKLFFCGILGSGCSRTGHASHRNTIVQHNPNRDSFVADVIEVKGTVRAEMGRFTL